MLILSQNSIQTIRLSGADHDVDNLAFKTLIAREINHLMTSGMTRQIVFGSRALTFGEYTQRLSDIRLVNFLLRRTLHSFEFEEACSLCSFGNVVFKLRGWRAGAFRILEDIKTVVLTLFHERQSLLEVFIRLTGKTDDDVARQRQTTARILDALDAFEIVAAFVTATHQFENAIAARLHGKMNPITEVLIFFNRRDDIRMKITRERRRKFDA